MEELAETLKWLDEYPLEETPYPKGYPEDLKFDLYPGKDFVVGLCDECIETSINLYPKAKDKEIMKTFINILKTVRAIRLKRLDNHFHPKPPPREPTFEEVVKQALF